MLGRVGIGSLCSRRGLAGKDLGHGESSRAKSQGSGCFLKLIRGRLRTGDRKTVALCKCGVRGEIESGI